MLAAITGGTGFIGSHLARALVMDGHSVRIVQRSTSRQDALVGIPQKKLDTAIADITDYPALCAAFTGCDWVFHVAAVADYWRADTERMMRVNVQGTEIVLRAARDAGVQRVIFTSSAAAIGISPDPRRPSDETVAFNAPPTHFPYGYSKHLAENTVQEALTTGQDIVTVNPVVVIGPNDLNMISGSYITQIARWGALVPNVEGGIAVTDVRDVAAGHLAAAKHGTTGERYILTTANFPNTTWFSMIAHALGTSAPRITLPRKILPLGARMIDTIRQIGIQTPVDSSQVRLGGQYIYFDGRKAWRNLHLPQVNMVDSLAETVAWYRARGML